MTWKHIFAAVGIGLTVAMLFVVVYGLIILLVVQ
jgi:hypothetical protein